MTSLWRKLVRAGQNLRTKWSEVSFEKKLAMFVAPVFVAVMSALLIPLVTGAGDDGDNTDDERTTETVSTQAAKVSGTGLEVAGLAVRDDDEDTRIDMTLRNAGDGVAIANRATFRITRFRRVGACLPEAYLLPSHTYDLVLPVTRPEGKLVDVDLSQAIKPDEADRIGFRVGVDDDDLTSTMSYLYRLDVQLAHDGARAPIRAGSLVVAKPFPGAHWFEYDGSDAEVERCVRANRAALAVVTAGEPAASPEMRALVRTAQAGS